MKQRASLSMNMRTIFLAVTSFVVLVLAVSCRSTFSKKQEVLSAHQDMERVDKPAREDVMWKIYFKLPRAKLEELAEKYVHATDWLSDWESASLLELVPKSRIVEDYSKFQKDYTAKYGHEYPAYLVNPPFGAGGWEILEKEPLWSVLKPLREDKELGPLLSTAEGRRVLSKEFLDVVTKHYICKHPERRDGWNVLWVFAQEIIEIAPYRTKVKELFRRYKLYRYPYGKIMWPDLELNWKPTTKL